MADRRRALEQLPHLTIIGWETVTEDKGAIAFAKGFYDAIGKSYSGHWAGGGGDVGGGLVSFADAYDAASRTFAEAGCVCGDPKPAGGAARPDVHGVHGMLGGVRRGVQRWRSGRRATGVVGVIAGGGYVGDSGDEEVVD